MESKYFYPRLCGGTFFCLLTELRRPRTSVRTTANKKDDGLSEPRMLADLIHVADPSYECPPESVFKSHTSRYKHCLISANTYLPFDRSDFVDCFDRNIKTQYETTLVGMDSFISHYITPSIAELRSSRLVSALVELIAEDSSISDSEGFFVIPSSKCISKLELTSRSIFLIQPFLLGVWHYIVTNRRDNLVGAETYNHWYSPSVPAKAKRDFISNIGQESRKDIIVERHHVHSLLPNAENGINIDKTAQENGEYDYSVYLKKAHNKYNKIKTLLYSDAPKPFYDFYVCNNLAQMSRFTNERRNVDFSDQGDIITVMDLLRRCSNFLIITGTGGIGKSMMMRHFLLDSIENYAGNKIVPFFVPLKDFSSSFSSLLEYIMNSIANLCDVTEIQLKNTLMRGEALFLLDGLDEINSGYVETFERYLEQFIDIFPQSKVIISSRRYSDFVTYQHFVVLDILPFRKEQALELIDKLEFREDEPSIKQKFRDQLDKTLYKTHKEFTETPLLLTIMLMTFEQFAEVPSKMHIFYREAFYTLAQKHDASKGAYKRQFQTGLTASRFKDRTLGRIGDFFDRQSHYWFSDRTFDMLYDMIPEKVEEYIFKPYLDNLIEKCQNGDGYWTFLETVHPSIEYYYDISDDASNEPISFLLRFILKILGGFEDSSLHNFPFYAEFIAETFVEVDDGSDMSQLLTLNEAENGEWTWVSEPVGYELSLDISYLLKNKEAYAEALEKLDAEDCILKQEYMKVRKYHQKLSKKFVVSSDDFFDQF